MTAPLLPGGSPYDYGPEGCCRKKVMTGLGWTLGLLGTTLVVTSRLIHRRPR